jgi:hypothetical protein
MSLSGAGGEKGLDRAGDALQHVVDIGDNFVGVLEVCLGVAHAEVKLPAELGHLGLDGGAGIPDLLDIV